jgi:S-DNA-T family DNA segregation ATPase FtsK/SpoIIIE
MGAVWTVVTVAFDLLLMLAKASPKIAGAVFAAWLLWTAYRMARGPNEKRKSIWQGWRVRYTWLRLARMLELVVIDPSPRFTFRLRGYRAKVRAGQQSRRVLIPRIRVQADNFGVIVRAKTRPGVGLIEWQTHAQHLADAWRCTRVAVTQAKPGRIVVRAVRLDPLTQRTTWQPTGQAPAVEEMLSWLLGCDEYASAVSVRLANVPGIAIAGLPGSGKTSVINSLLARYAPSPVVQFALADGKAAGDYDDMRQRFFRFVGDDLAEANELLRGLVDLRRRRAAVIRDPVEAGGMGVKNFWTTGPTEAWPLIVVIVDEAHTYFAEYKGADPETKKLAALASENRRLVEDLIKKGRSLGFLTVLATQKATGDAIPTSIRDVCPVAMSFAQTTQAGAVAALGEDIREYPEANPVALQGAEYVGCASMKVETRPGFTRVRMPLVADEDVARVCAQSAYLTRDPAQLLPRRLVPLPSDVASSASRVAAGEVV